LNLTPTKDYIVITKLIGEIEKRPEKKKNPKGGVLKDRALKLTRRGV
jgi:hypothetical protein